MKSQEVNLAKHGTGSDNAFAVLEKVAAESLDKSSSISYLPSRCDSGVEAGRDGFPCSLFENVDYLGGLERTDQ